MKKKWLKRSLWAVAFLATLVVLFYAEEDWRGARALRRVEAELKARGEPLDPKALVTPPIPDELNIAAAPVFAELYEKPESETRLGSLREFFASREGVARPISMSVRLFGASNVIDIIAWQKWLTGRSDPATAARDVLAAMEKYRPLTEEVRMALARPGLRWPVTSSQNPFVEQTPYLGVMLSLASFLQLRADAEIEAGDGEAALQDLLLMFRLSGTLEKGFVVPHFLVAAACDGYSYAVLARGLERRVWNEPLLRRIAVELDRKDPLAEFRTAIRQERLGDILLSDLSLYDQFRTLCPVGDPSDRRNWPFFTLFALPPKGWKKIDEADAILTIQEGFIDPVDTENMRLDVAEAEAVWKRREKVGAAKWLRPLRAMVIPALEGSLRRAGMGQAWLVEARAACALEQFRLRSDGLPARLDVLVPGFLSRVPVDPMDGRSLRYHREGDAYLLYSVGWNGKDDGGLVDRKTKGLKGDWPWASQSDLYRFMPVAESSSGH